MLASSTSGFRCQLREGVAVGQIVAHPYNPVYLLPAVELVGGIDNVAILAAEQILKEIGMKPVILRREIDAHVQDNCERCGANLWLVKDDVATTAEMMRSLAIALGCDGRRWVCLRLPRGRW